MQQVTTRFLQLTGFALILIGISACDSSEPEDGGGGEQELITRVVLNLTAGGNTTTAEATDPDGDGTNFEIDTIVLAAGLTYSGTIGVFDDVNEENITLEIEGEAEEHQFFYLPGGGIESRVSVESTDRDANDLPIGLEFDLVDAGSGEASGSLRVILSHYDETPKNGTDRSDETDVDVTFPVTIE